eukprot:TRINITY_DN21343_c0_g1_i1.p4 TRINITY_DN21343_c0_g1~~TRINITY_DN21343_c0_g1_i1.p4  ORF type:complete len:104 (+),score=19.26 TRINITY_DN21343_c0_g1_i1:128-439(+)
MQRGLVGSEMCIRDRRRVHGGKGEEMKQKTGKTRVRGNEGMEEEKRKTRNAQKDRENQSQDVQREKRKLNRQIDRKPREGMKNKKRQQGIISVKVLKKRDKQG